MKAAGKRPPATPRLGARLRREACQGESARNPRVHMDLARQAPSPTLTRALHAGGQELLDANRGLARACLFRAASATAAGRAPAQADRCPACGLSTTRGDAAPAIVSPAAGARRPRQTGPESSTRPDDACPGSLSLSPGGNRAEALEQELARERDKCAKLQDRCDRQKASLKAAQQDVEELSARLAHFVDFDKELQVRWRRRRECTRPRQTPLALTSI